MPVGKGKAAISTVLPDELKSRLQRIADNRKWTLSQTVRECLELYIGNLETELGISTSEPAQSSKKSKSR
jgi:predicted DNA-binding protein